ncbi:hypothetical protein SPRG_11776 [Saprolegnia parasitica CBS 223.65]|uniref:Proteasome assembly chaperone 1 n=1 Tax=Saprolegnia parasitica (strain CBS 223.65) TaxID=695850 RepID=A0A067C7Y8_SAPPC|nr:hypothetical protein SPRG_11776 [Saprolegnia parasitica CBS 223.65]KDO22932.1 hypothetical protein SPRG_11776 [Saprolegnia parasitica CBS 223.65]|eukprot:XP_012206368.1 hypothetical protein SPRG_11776 [Saprolegnia parasitica CBS 223.65]
MALQLRYPEEADFHSRTFVDVEEAPAPALADAIFRWSPSVRADLARRNETCLTPARLLVATGAEATAFAKTISQGSPVLGTLVLSTTPIAHTTFGAGPAAVCALVALTPETLLLLAPLEVAENDVWTFVDALFAHVAPQEVMSLSALMSVTYDATLHDGCVLYQLASSPLSEVPMLPAPRFVTGIPAALLTYCTLRRRRASVFVSLLHPTTSLLESTRCFAPLLAHLGLSSVPTTKSLDDAATTKSFESLYI